MPYSGSENIPTNLKINFLQERSPVPKRLDPDEQDRRPVRLDLGQNCLQRLSPEDKLQLYKKQTIQCRVDMSELYLVLGVSSVKLQALLVLGFRKRSGPQQNL